jgi:hypothetical protein
MKVSLASFLILVSFLLCVDADNVIQIGCITISGVPEDAVLLKYDNELFDTDRDRANQCGVSRTTWQSGDDNRLRCRGISLQLLVADRPDRQIRVQMLLRICPE